VDGEGLFTLWIKWGRFWVWSGMRVWTNLCRATPARGRGW